LYNGVTVMSNPEKEHKKDRRKKREKERNKALRSKKYICSLCGFMGKPIKEKKGKWSFFFLRLLLGVPIIVVMFVLSLIEGAFRIIGLSRPKSIIWQSNFSTFLPYEPYVRKGCPECGLKNSMKKLKSDAGQNIYDCFERDRFLKKYD
jgi:predicted RNA-binding Zn-ribbon protein involved in translation (DUF1610 family)